ncbi:hypothetical protein F5Y15DRAFT_318778 [Xylariaceae sp. FL0016]|nr:hypothetical protein F5Y15DRAFT_318778 [Xylariaceae sp. FL0016]
MSSPAAVPKSGKEKRGMGKVLYRVKTVFRKGESASKRASSAAPAPAPIAGFMSPPSVVPVRKQPEFPGATRIPRIQVHEERAKKLGAKFGLEIKPSEWHSTEGDVFRVEKPVRMRIHRECHRCHAPFGAATQCSNCSHTRCKSCVRYPAPRTEPERIANREKRDALRQKNRDLAPIIPSYDYSEKIVLTRPSKSGGQDLVYKGRPRMRVRRHCHQCNSLISAHGQEARTCGKCGHKRCADCPRNPEAKKKYPYGYPNDEPGENNKGVHSCHECKKKFPPNVDHGYECPRCSHPMCAQCPRVKPRKVDPEPDPDILESLRLRMAELKTSD